MFKLKGLNLVSAQFPRPHKLVRRLLQIPLRTFTVEEGEIETWQISLLSASPCQVTQD
jgi:hypothetical protein